MVAVKLKNITKRFGDVVAVERVNLEVEKGELFFLLGPSGCGKSTMLRAIAGFNDPEEGTIQFDDIDITRVPSHKRNTGMVFQNYALWPHMSVYDNVAYGLDIRKISATEKEKRVKEALAMVRMEAYSQRRPNQLSGGQQQRIALARALVIEPNVILLDEPLSNLDAKLRLEMRDEIRRIHRDTGITTIYVTHDQKEALSMADRMAVMNEGRVEQVGTPRDVYCHPTSPFVAGFIGETNFINGNAGSGGNDFLRITTPVGELLSNPPEAIQVGKSVQCSIRPEALQLVRGEPPKDVGIITAKVEALTYLGEVEQYDLVTSDGSKLRAVELNPGEPPAPGEDVRLFVHPKDVVVFQETGE